MQQCTHFIVFINICYRIYKLQQILINYMKRNILNIYPISDESHSLAGKVACEMLALSCWCLSSIPFTVLFFCHPKMVRLAPNICIQNALRIFPQVKWESNYFSKHMTRKREHTLQCPEGLPHCGSLAHRV